MQVKNNKIKDGIDNLMKSYSLEKENIDILIKIGEAYLMFDEEEQVNEAISYLTKAIEMDNKNYDCLIGLGKAYDNKGDLEKAIRFTELAIE